MKNKLLFSVFVYFIILTLLSLGFWQIYRLNWKLELIEQIENSLKNDPVELSNVEKKNYLRIKTSGDIDFDKQIYLYNLNDAGKPGFEVINPIKIGDVNYLFISLLSHGSPSIDSSRPRRRRRLCRRRSGGRVHALPTRMCRRGQHQRGRRACRQGDDGFAEIPDQGAVQPVPAQTLRLLPERIALPPPREAGGAEGEYQRPFRIFMRGGRHPFSIRSAFSNRFVKI